MPLIEAEVERKFGPAFGRGGGEQPQAGRCPGEEACEDFVFGGRDLRICGVCPKESTKPKGQPVSTEHDGKILRTIERLASEIDMGYPPGLDEMTPLEYELLLQYRAKEADCERRLRVALVMRPQG